MEAEERPTKLRKVEGEATNNGPTMTQENGLNAVAPLRMPVEDLGELNTHHKSAGADATETNEPDAINSDSLASENHGGSKSHAAQSTSPAPLSKNELKRIRNKERWEASRDSRKLKRKQKIVEKRVRKRAAREEAQAAATNGLENASREGEQAAETRFAHDCQKPTMNAERPPDKPKRPSHTVLPIAFVIDCGFDDLMTEREMISLGSQLTRSYSDNHKAPFQAHLFVSSWGGMLKQRFDTILEKHYESWKSVTFMEEDFVGAAERANKLMRGGRRGKLAGAFAAKSNDKSNIENASQAVAEIATGEDNAAWQNGVEAEKPEPAVIRSEADEHLADETSTSAAREQAHNPQSNASAKPDHSMTRDEDTCGEATTVDESAPPPGAETQPKGETIYLTSDSPHTLDRLQPYSTYIIGGLVDKNRHKGICYKTACDRGIKTAKLPIGEFMEMQSRFVLATNHVVEIMVRWLECGDWGESFVKVMPKRKGGVLKAAASGVRREVHGNGVEDDDVTTAGHDDLGEAGADALSDDNA